MYFGGVQIGLAFSSNGPAPQLSNHYHTDFLRQQLSIHLPDQWCLKGIRSLLIDPWSYVWMSAQLGPLMIGSLTIYWAQRLLSLFYVPALNSMVGKQMDYRFINSAAGIY